MTFAAGVQPACFVWVIRLGVAEIRTLTGASAKRSAEPLPAHHLENQEWRGNHRDSQKGAFEVLSFSIGKPARYRAIVAAYVRSRCAGIVVQICGTANSTSATTLVFEHRSK